MSRIKHPGRDVRRPGYGTYPGVHSYQGIDRYTQSVKWAVQYGFRHIDTAQTYENEQYVGHAISEAGIPRGELFVTTKLDPSRNSRTEARVGIELSLTALNLEFVDLFLIHYPGEGDPVGAWEALRQLKMEGKCKHVGVSNFEIPHLQVLQRLTGTLPEVNQIEFHPFLYSPDLIALVKFCQDNHIEVEGYCPLAWQEALQENVVQQLAGRYGVPPAQVLLRWCVQHGVRPIVGALEPQHIQEDAGPFTFELATDDVVSIDGLGRQLRIAERWGWDPTRITPDQLQKAYSPRVPASKEGRG